MVTSHEWHQQKPLDENGFFSQKMYIQCASRVTSICEKKNQSCAIHIVFFIGCFQCYCSLLVLFGLNLKRQSQMKWWCAANRCDLETNEYISVELLSNEEVKMNDRCCCVVMNLWKEEIVCMRHQWVGWCCWKWWEECIGVGVMIAVAFPSIFKMSQSTMAEPPPLSAVAMLEKLIEQAVMYWRRKGISEILGVCVFKTILVWTKELSFFCQKLFVSES